jgi:hypothetical protein
MNVEIVMTRESFDCLEKLIPKELSEGMQAPVFLQASGTTPHQVVLNLQSRDRAKAARDRPTPM